MKGIPAVEVQNDTQKKQTIKAQSSLISKM